MLPVARGDDEASWVELASRETVRALEEAVKAERASAADEEWGRWTVGCTPEDREAIDDALARARQELPGSKTFQRLEAIAQEFLGTFPEEDAEVEDGERRTLREHYRSRDEREARLASRKAALEEETDRWASLPPIPPWAAPDAGSTSSRRRPRSTRRCARSPATARAGTSTSAGLLPLARWRRGAEWAFHKPR